MIGQATAQARLCPHCANSIAADAVDCSYCKRDVSPQLAPSWLHRDESNSESRIRPVFQRLPAIPAKFAWIGGMVTIALIGFFAGAYMQRGKLARSAEATQKQIQAKDKMIQTQEAQLAQTRQQLNDNSQQLAEIKTKLEDSRKELSLAQQRLTVAARRVDQPAANRSPVVQRTAARVSYPAPSLPPARRTAVTGVYETIRPTAVHEDPTSGSRVISQIERGTRINVVSSAGEWLEVRSRYGKPPGYVRSDDARPSGGVN